MNLRDLRLRVRALLRPRRVERELDDELAFHVERETQKHLASGLSPADARARALARFGPVPLAADQCRDARGTAFIDGCVRDVLYAIRMFRRAPLVALTIVATVALGLGLVAIVFTWFNRFVFRVDAVPNPHELYAVERARASNGGRAGFTLQDYDAIRRETRVFTDVFAMLPDIDSRIGGRMMAGTLVTGNFFEVLGVNAVRGRALTPADDERFKGRPVIVLSHRGWTRHFAGDPDVVGRELVVSGRSFEIVGVMPEGFRGLGVGTPDYWGPLSLLGEFRPVHAGREGTIAIDVVGRLKPGMSAATARAGLAVWDAGRGDGAPAGGRGSNITMEPRQGTVAQPFEAVLLFSPFFFAFGLILMIACANVANLLLARAVARQREIGIRLSLGASRRRIVRQLLTESLLLALISAACAYAVSRLVMAAALLAARTTMPPEVSEMIHVGMPAADWRVILFLVAGALLSTVSFGLAPALQATRLELVRTMRGELTKDARPGRARNTLIGVQVGASALLLICAAVFLRSAFAAATADPGFRTADTIIVDVVNEGTRTALIQAIAAEPYVAGVAASWPDTLSRPREAFADSGVAKTTVAYQFVTPEYFGVLDIPIVRGRGFAASERDASAAVLIVSESTARKLWPNGDAVGQVLHVDPDPNFASRREDEPPLRTRSFTIIGVARDVARFRLAEFEAAGVYVPASAALAETSLTVRVHGDPDVARRSLLDRLTAIDPNMGQVFTMRTLARMETYVLKIAFWLTLVLGGLALMLTVSGLFSVLSYLVEQRAKEIGVRMALGATARSVVLLVLFQSVRPVGFGLLAGGGLAAAVGVALLATPAAAQIGTMVRVLDPIAYATSILCIVAACVLAGCLPALRAARIDPMETLRQD
jgi:predicted permease